VDRRDFFILLDPLFIGLSSVFACAFYVGVAVCGTPQEWLRSALLFGIALFFGCWRGVGCV